MSFFGKLFSSSFSNNSNRKSNNYDLDPRLSKIYELGGKADKGDIEAQYILGTCFLNGNGVSKNYKIAIDWFTKAYKHGHAKAAYQIGLMYLTGQAGYKDGQKAVEFFYIAYQMGLPEAKNALVKMQNEGRDVEYIIRQYEQRTEKENKSSYNNTLGNEYSTEQHNSSTAVGNNQQNVANTSISNGLDSHYIKAQNSKLLFDQAVELKRKGQYAAALMLYKQAYNTFPDDPDVQSTMYAMAKIYLLTGDYEKACTLFQDGLTMKLAQTDERTGRFYQKNVMSEFSGGLSESDPDYQWFHKLTADYSIFIGLSHYLLENDGYELLSRYRYDFNNHMQSVAGKSAPQPSADYLRTCYDYGWSRVIAIASESYNRCFDKIDFGHVQKRKQEFLDILETI